MAEPEASTTELSPQQRLKSTRRNDLCPCGSGKKYKKCHLVADEADERKRLADVLHQAELARAAEEAAAAEDSDEDGADAGPTKKKRTAGPGAKPKQGSKLLGKGSGTATRPNNLPRRKAI